MKAIQVKYLAATNTRPSRLKAFADGVKPLVASFDHGEDDGGARNVAEALCRRQAWPLKLISGSLPNGDLVFVFAE